MTPPDATPGRGALDRVSLIGLSAVGHHGVLTSERRDGQVFRADVVVHLDTRAAAAADDLALTVDYADLAERVVAVLAGEPVDLLETLAQRVADVALRLPRVAIVEVVLHKPQAPIPVPFDDVQVAIRRVRRHLGPRSGPVRAPSLDVDPHPDPHPDPHSDPDPDPPPDPQVDPLDRRPNGEVGVVLALGGNEGDVAATLRHAIRDLAAAEGLTITDVSPLARTAAVGPEQADYLNAVVGGRTSLSPRELLALTSSIEDSYGRVRAERWGPRTLDVDVVAVDGVSSSDPVLVLPHPRAHERAFVLVPWAAMDPDAVLDGPGGGRVADLADVAPDRSGVRWLAPGWFEEPADR